MFKLTHLILVLYCLVGFTSYGQKYNFVSFSTKEGLPQSQVTAITQDKQGYVWVGTLGGLARFNGSEFVSFSYKDGLLNNRISALKWIGDSLLIGHTGGISIHYKGTFSNFKLPENFYEVKITDIDFFDGKFWVSTFGKGLYQLKNDQLLPTKLLPDSIEVLNDLFVHHSQLFIATNKGVWKMNDHNFVDLLTNTKAYDFQTIGESKEQLIFGSIGGGFFKYANNHQLINKGKSPIKQIFSNAMQEYCVLGFEELKIFKDDQLWIALNASNGLPQIPISCTFIDNEGDLWIGTEGKGLIRFTGFALYSNTNTSLNLSLCFNQNYDKSIWVGTYDKGILQLKNDKVVQEIPYLDPVWCSVLNVDGSHWFGTNFGLLAIRNNKIATVYYVENGLPSDKISALLKLNNHSFIVGGVNGISIYENGKITLYRKNQIGVVRQILKTQEGYYLACSKGLFLFKNKLFYKVHDFGNAIYSIAKTEDDILWIGTEEGLYTLMNGKIKELYFDDTPASSLINFLYPSKNKILVGTNNGVFLLEFHGKKLIKRNIGLEEGVVDLETNLNSGKVIGKDFYFGTASGMMIWKDFLNYSFKSEPKILLENVSLNGRNVEFQKAGDLTYHIRYNYKKSELVLKLDGIALKEMTGLKYSYKISNESENWSPYVRDPFIILNGLSPGEHLVLVKAIDKSNNKSKSLRILIYIKPAFYQTWWFYSLLGLLFVGIVYGVIQYRIYLERNRSYKEKLEYKAKLLTLEQQSLNASMNRHFIFNSLNSIQYFINTQDKLSANKFLTNFAKLIRKNLDSATEDGNMVTLTQEIERLNLYLTLESMRFKDRFDYVINVEVEDTDAIEIPAMLLQPFVENSIIHGILPIEDRKGLIEVNIVIDEKNNLCIDIEDNGVGYLQSINKKSKSEGDHQSKGTQITNKRVEILEKLMNREFRIIGPEQIYNSDRSIKGSHVLIKIQLDNLDN